MTAFSSLFRNSVVCALALVACAVVFAQQATSYEIAPFAPDLMLYRGVGMTALRPIAELLGASISAEGKAVVVSRGGKKFSCTPGNTVVSVNGTKRTLAVAPFACKGVVYGPLQDCLDALGGKLSVNVKMLQATVTCPWLARPLTLPVERTTGDTSLFKDEGTELFVMNTDGTHLKRLTYTLRTNYELPIFSRDSSTMVLPLDARLYRRDITHPALTEIDRQSLGKEYDFAYCWYTPDNRHVLFSTLEFCNRPEELTLLSVDGAHKQILGPGNTPWISPDGTRIAYVATDEENKNPVVTLMDADGNNHQVIGEGEDPVFLPGGKILAYSRKLTCADGRTRRVIVLRHTNADGTVTEYAPTPDTCTSSEYFSDYSQDGGQVLFMRGEEVKDGWGTVALQGLFIMQADRTNVRQLTSNDSDDSAAFIDGGTRIFFHRHTIGFHTMSVAGGEPTSLPLPAIMWIGSFMMTPDEKRIIFRAAP